MNREEKLIFNVFNELRCSGNFEDDEYKQMDKILNIINTNIEKYKVDDENYNVFDSLLGEVEELRGIVAEKYIKIGNALGTVIS